jgi:hypothetical protein
MDALRYSKNNNLPSVTVLFLFTFFNLILDAPRIKYMRPHIRKLYLKRSLKLLILPRFMTLFCRVFFFLMENNINCKFHVDTNELALQKPKNNQKTEKPCKRSANILHNHYSLKEVKKKCTNNTINNKQNEN